METKTCIKCGEKPITEFSKRTKTTYQSTCKACSSEYHKAHYQKYKEYYKAKAKRQDAETVQRLKKIAEDHKSVPCADCKKCYPHWVMDFDHLDGSQKLDNVSALVNGAVSERKLLEEIAKCEVVCSNCHRDRTYKRRLNLGH